MPEKPKLLYEFFQIAKKYNLVGVFDRKNNNNFSYLTLYQDDVDTVFLYKDPENAIESTEVSLEELKKMYRNVTDIIYVYFTFRLIKELTGAKTINQKTTKKLVRAYCEFYGIEISDYVCDQIVTNL
ncbi:MAG: hypothetical protein QXF12_04280 [Candidatus Aenigmatarchaeota archaeon]